MRPFDSGRHRSRRPRQHHRRPDRRNSRFLIPVLLLALQPFALFAQSGLLEASILEGDGQVCRPGSRLPRPLVIQITDETGSRVPDALVSFRLPEDGVTGTFRNGLKTELISTDGDGRVALRTFQAGGLAGQFEIHMLVAKGGARAGAISRQYVAPNPRGDSGLRSAVLRPRRILEIGALVLAVGAAGYLKTHSTGSTSSTTHVETPPTIGPPTVVIGKP